MIQILPGPFPFPDSAAPTISSSSGPSSPASRHKSRTAPTRTTWRRSPGTFKFTAWDKGATRDSVDGVAAFTTQDGARWKVVMDRVQTQDVPHHPRFGGVILGLYYHGNTAVHTPLVLHDQERRRPVGVRSPLPERRARD